MKLLDIGMGQGPMGVVAISVGVKSYKGMDPALCINQHASLMWFCKFWFVQKNM